MGSNFNGSNTNGLFSRHNLQLVPQRQHFQLQDSARARATSDGQQERETADMMVGKRTSGSPARSTLSTGTDFSIGTT
jgi:hypothetical protein